MSDMGFARFSVSIHASEPDGAKGCPAVTRLGSGQSTMGRLIPLFRRNREGNVINYYFV
jgi:hypothetical protein